MVRSPRISPIRPRGPFTMPPTPPRSPTSLALRYTARRHLKHLDRKRNRQRPRHLNFLIRMGMSLVIRHGPRMPIRSRLCMRMRSGCRRRRLSAAVGVPARVLGTVPEIGVAMRHANAFCMVALGTVAGALTSRVPFRDGAVVQRARGLVAVQIRRVVCIRHHVCCVAGGGTLMLDGVLLCGRET